MFVKKVGWSHILLKIVGGAQDVFERCPDCGLVIDRTLYEMTTEEWEDVNYKCHSSYQGTDEDPADPKWISRLNTQAAVLAGLFDCDVYSLGMKTVDYGCGDGKLSKYTDDAYEARAGKRLSHKLIGKYDRYMAVEDEGYYTDDDMVPNSFDVVISCSVIEHLIGSDEINRFFSLANDKGTICLHTIICEEVPRDPEWFYLSTEGHCTFWTNAAMLKIYENYGFVGCAYNLEARMCFFFKDENRYTKLKENYDRIVGSLTLSDSFIDYWK